VGGTVTAGILNIRAGVNNVFIDPNSQVPQGIYDTAINDTDTDISFNLGVHWRALPKLSFGAVYRGGLKFNVREDILNDTIGLSGNPPVPFPPLSTSFNTPDSYGAGVAWRPMSALTVSADWVHIKYSDLLDGFQAGLNVLTLGDPTPAKFTIDDADEIHFGAEYVFSAGTVPWAVRAGFFTDHNSRIFADFVGGVSSFSDNKSFPPRDTETHVTVGTGVVVKERFQIDAAADFSQIANEYVLSTIFRF
jgi:long-subunit fatty acid transport protein